MRASTNRNKKTKTDFYLFETLFYFKTETYINFYVADYKMEYLVVFESKTPAYKGVRTWRDFDSLEDFQRWFDSDMQKRYDVVDEGISEAEAIALAAETTLSAYQASFLATSINPDTLEFDERKFGDRVRMLDWTLAQEKSGNQ
jgi:hypothetical protein